MSDNCSSLINNIESLDRLVKSDQFSSFGETVAAIEKQIKGNRSMNLETLKQLLLKINGLQASVARKKQIIADEIIKISKKRKLIEKYRPK